MPVCMSVCTDSSADEASHSGVSADSAPPVLLEDWELDSLVTRKYFVIADASEHPFRFCRRPDMSTNMHAVCYILLMRHMLISIGGGAQPSPVARRIACDVAWGVRSNPSNPPWLRACT